MAVLSREGLYGRAMTSISTSTFLGRVLTATQLRAGLCENHFSYSVLISCEQSVTGIWSIGFTGGADSKVGHVRDKDSGLDNLGDGRTSLLNDSLDVLAGLSGLLSDALDHFTLRSKRDLTGTVDHVGGLDGLRLLGRIS